VAAASVATRRSFFRANRGTRKFAAIVCPLRKRFGRMPQVRSRFQCQASTAKIGRARAKWSVVGQRGSGSQAVVRVIIKQIPVADELGGKKRWKQVWSNSFKGFGQSFYVFAVPVGSMSNRRGCKNDESLFALANGRQSIPPPFSPPHPLPRRCSWLVT